MLAIEQIMLFLLEGAFFELYKFELFQNKNCKISNFYGNFY